MYYNWFDAALLHHFLVRLVGLIEDGPGFLRHLNRVFLVENKREVVSKQTNSLQQKVLMTSRVEMGKVPLS